MKAKLTRMDGSVLEVEGTAEEVRVALGERYWTSPPDWWFYRPYTCLTVGSGTNTTGINYPSVTYHPATNSGT